MNLSLSAFDFWFQFWKIKKCFKSNEENYTLHSVLNVSKLIIFYFFEHVASSESNDFSTLTLSNNFWYVHSTNDTYRDKLNILIQTVLFKNIWKIFLFYNHSAFLQFNFIQLNLNLSLSIILYASLSLTVQIVLIFDLFSIKLKMHQREH